MTKETEKAFKILYCEFKRRRKSGASKPAAMEFDAQGIQNLNAFQKWLPEDIDYALQELKTANYVKYFITGDCELTETGLDFMESKPKDFFSELAGLFDLISLFC
ncbi:MAG: hypothetical protein IJX01_07515 [Oscillospiraceae bacterium]|nr:hypothetical protein [Oscillospiraceae bacterium]